MRCKLDHASFSLFCPRPWPCTNPSVNLSNIPLLPAIPCFLVIFPFHSWPYASSIVVYGKVVAFFSALFRIAVWMEIYIYIFIIFEQWVMIIVEKIYLKKGKILTFRASKVSIFYIFFTKWPTIYGWKENVQTRYFLILNHRFKVTFKKKTIKRPETRIYSTLPSHIIIANFKLSNFLDKSPYLLSTIKYSITQQHPHSYVTRRRTEKDQHIGVPLSAIQPR